MELFETFTNPSMLHAAIVHLPIALAIVGIPLVYVCAALNGDKNTLRWVAVGCYATLTICAIGAEWSGDGARGKVPPELPATVWNDIDRHESMGEAVWIFGAITTALLLLSVARIQTLRSASIALAMVASLGAGIWVVLTGHYGGMLIYSHGLGTPMMAAVSQPPPVNVPAPQIDPPAGLSSEPQGAPIAQAEIEQFPGAQASEDSATAGAFAPEIRPFSMDEAKGVSYVRDVRPILAEKCEECHNPDKARGDFDVTSVAAMLEGGKKAGPGIVPGDPDASPVVKYIRGELRPQMPKGEDPLTAEELHLIRMWIAAGAVDDSANPPSTPPAAQSGPAAPGEDAAPAPTPSEPTVPAQAPSAADLEAALNAALFSAGPEEILVQRRNLRLAMLPEPPRPPEVAVPVFNEIDQFIAAQWSQVDPEFVGEVADDLTFLRRVYLDVVGRIPPEDAARAFAGDPSANKRDRVIDELLSRAEEYAAHWTPFWEDALCSNGNHQGGVGTRGNYREWIFNSFKSNKPYDLFVSELLDPHMPGHPGRFVLRQDHTRILKSAADTAQVFLGTSLKCASCHNHFDNREWSQERFMGFAGYFAHEDVEIIRCEAKTGRFVPTCFIFEMPGVPGGVPESPEGRIARAAQLITDPLNPRFAKTIVNRLWKRFMGLGFFEPADDFRLDVPPSHPELLEWLAHDFMTHGYDLKHTIRMILASRSYQLRYNAAVEDRYDVTKPLEPRYFRSPALRRMTAEQLMDSIRVAVHAEWTDQDRLYRRDDSTSLTRALGRPATRNEVSTARSDEAAVVLALEMLNGEEYFETMYGADLIYDLARRSVLEKSPAAAADSLYWSALNRPPTEAERAAAAEFLSLGNRQETTAVVENVYMDDRPPSASGEPYAWIGPQEGQVFSGTAALRLGRTELVPDPGAAAPGSTAVSVGMPAETPVLAESIGTETEAKPAVSDETSEPTSQPAAGPAPVHVTLNGFEGADPIEPDDSLFAYVYLDPATPPEALAIEWTVDNSSPSRAAWGEESHVRCLLKDAVASYTAPLPPVGQWNRLEVPANLLGLGRDQKPLAAITVHQLGGVAYWDKAGRARPENGGPTEALGDMMWALLTSPEFQYIR